MEQGFLKCLVETSNSVTKSAILAGLLTSGILNLTNVDNFRHRKMWLILSFSLIWQEILSMWIYYVWYWQPLTVCRTMGRWVPIDRRMSQRLSFLVTISCVLSYVIMFFSCCILRGFWKLFRFWPPFIFHFAVSNVWFGVLWLMVFDVAWLSDASAGDWVCVIQQWEIWFEAFLWRRGNCRWLGYLLIFCFPQSVLMCGVRVHQRSHWMTNAAFLCRQTPFAIGTHPSHLHQTVKQVERQTDRQTETKTDRQNIHDMSWMSFWIWQGHMSVCIVLTRQTATYFLVWMRRSVWPRHCALTHTATSTSMCHQ